MDDYIKMEMVDEELKQWRGAFYRELAVFCNNTRQLSLPELAGFCNMFFMSRVGVNTVIKDAIKNQLLWVDAQNVPYIGIDRPTKLTQQEFEMKKREMVKW